MEFKYGINEKPKTKRETILLAIQHVFAMFGSTILVPTLIGLDPAVSLVTAGVGTLIYSACTKSKVPVFIGSSFAYIGLLSGLYSEAGAQGVGLAVISVGIIYVIFAAIISMVGSGFIDKLLPPVVIGPVIIVIGMSLAPVAIQNAGLSSESFHLNSAIIALTSFSVTTIALLRGNNFTKSVPVIIGILSGYIVALMLGEVDLSIFATQSFINIPEFSFVGLDYSLAFEPQIIAAVIPLVFVTMAEHIGDHKVSSAITDKNFTKDPGLHRTLLGDGIATLFAGIVGGPVNTTYAENTGVIILTKIASTYVIKIAAVFAIILAFFGPLTAFIASIPISVMGGISIILFGLIAQNGFKILKDSNVDLNSGRNMIIIGSVLVFGLGGAILQFTIMGITFSFSYMSLAAIIGILLNIILPKELN